jgi:hypothetical protein
MPLVSKFINYRAREYKNQQDHYIIIKSKGDFLSPIETCKEYKNILLGFHVKVLTDY